MKLTNAYIIDGDVIEKIKSELKEDIQLYTEVEVYCDDLKHRLKAIEELEQQHLKPALPIVEESFKAGRTVCNYKGEWEETYNDDMTKAKYKSFNDYFLTKDF